jgi:RNA-directed DNA polymerase
MLSIFRPAVLASRVGTTLAELEDILHAGDRYYEELILTDPRKPNKSRIVIAVKSPLRQLQGRFYQRVLLPSLAASKYSHGSRRESSIKTNAQPHTRSRFVCKADVSNFFPSIHDSRVYKLFNGRLGCPAKVADLCSRLCTYRHHLALGLSTSPILADQLMSDVDVRIGAACEAAGLIYTRYVDDITISGGFDLAMGKAGIASLVGRILAAHGFAAKRSKYESERNGQTTITGVRIKKGRLDVAKAYAAELDRQLADAASLADDGAFDGPYFTRSQILGRIQFVGWINPGRKRSLQGRFLKINWRNADDNAMTRGWVASRKRVQPRSVAENAPSERLRLCTDTDDGAEGQDRLM